MNKAFRVFWSVLAALVVAVSASVALSAPAHAMTVAANTNTNPSTQVVDVRLDADDISKIGMSWYWAEALCQDTTNAIVPTTSSWFSWSAPTPSGTTGVNRCAWDLYDCVEAGGLRVTFVNYAGPLGWSYWKDTCNFS